MNPCCNLSLFHGARYMAIVDIISAALASIIITIQIISLTINGVAVNNENVPLQETYINRILIAYLIVNLVNLILSVLLFQGIRTDNIGKCQSFVLLSSLSTIFGLCVVIYHGFHLSELRMSIFNTEFFILLAYHLYKIYLLSVIFAFVLEQKSNSRNMDSSRHTYESLQSNDKEDIGDPVGANYFSVPFPQKYCILEESLKIDYDTCIEYDEKTSTVNGLLQQTFEREVAIKTLKSSYRSEKFMTELAKEASLLASIGNHQHIIQLVGICFITTPIRGDNIFLIMENFPSRRLDDFLRNAYENGLQNFQNLMGRGSYIKRQTQRLGTLYENLPVNYFHTEPFSTMNMIQWAYQLSSAMDYLHSKKIILGNLQAKSLVLIQISTLKLSNFSFASELRENNNKILLSDMPGRVSWRWTALECLNSASAGIEVEFNEKTDVWSYGSTIYEIFSMGYSAKVSGNLTDYIQALQQGERPEKPSFALEGVYNLMKTCWSLDPMDRPNFKFITLFFSQLLTTSVQHFQ